MVRVRTGSAVASRRLTVSLSRLKQDDDKRRTNINIHTAYNWDKMPKTLIWGFAPLKCHTVPSITQKPHPCLFLIEFALTRNVCNPSNRHQQVIIVHRLRSHRTILEIRPHQYARCKSICTVTLSQVYPCFQCIEHTT